MSLTQAWSDKIIKVIKNLSRLDRYGADKEISANTLRQVRCTTAISIACFHVPWPAHCSSTCKLLMKTRFSPIFSQLNKTFTILEGAINFSSCLPARFLSHCTQQSHQSQGTSFLQFSLAPVSKKKKKVPIKTRPEGSSLLFLPLQ